MSVIILDISLVLAGALFLILSLLSARNILKEQDTNRNGWLILFSLILLFIAGYLYFSYSLFQHGASALSHLLSLILFGGGLFVILVVNMSLSSIREVIHIAERERHRAMHDDLTELANRPCLYEHMLRLLKRAARKHDQVMILLMDLDRFKEINDTLGHHYGDELLRRIAPRLRQCVRKEDIVARIGGDEFAIILPNTNIQGAMKVINKVTKYVERSYEIDGHTLAVGLSIGLSRYPIDGESCDELLKKADVAMYTAKRTGATYAIYDASIDENSIKRLNMASELRTAVQQDQMQMYYQPKVDMQTRQITGMEALVRWHHPKYGFMEPSEFICIAEQNGLINPLTRWILHTALEEFRPLAMQYRELSLSVNLSAKNLLDEGLPDILALYLQECDIEPQRLTLEITESSLLQDMENASRILHRLHEKGVKISIDDFGTGYSSMAHLTQLPISEIKIDKSFVINMLENDTDAIIVRTTIDLAHNTGKVVTAEGVENQEIFDLLEILRCDMVQGYHLHQPMPMAKFLDLLSQTA